MYYDLVGVILSEEILRAKALRMTLFVVILSEAKNLT